MSHARSRGGAYWVRKIALISPSGTATAIAMGIVLSETTSNTTAANMLVPVMIAAAKSAGVSPVAPAHRSPSRTARNSAPTCRSPKAV